MNDDQKLIAFAEMLGVPDLTPEGARAFAERVGPSVFQRILIRAEEALSSEDLAAAGEYLEREDFVGLLAFLRERVPGFADLLAEVMRT